MAKKKTKKKATKAKECVCPEFVPLDEAVDIFVPVAEGFKLVARYHKDCPVHGYKVIR